MPKMLIDGAPFALPSPLERLSVNPAPAGCRKGYEMSLPDLHVHHRRDIVARPDSPLAFLFPPSLFATFLHG